MAAVISVQDAERYYTESDTAHGFDHVLRVWRLAMRIGTEEGADLEVLQAAALLHDIGRPTEEATGICHAEVGAAMAREILAARSVPAERIEAVACAIAEHRYRGTQAPQSLEARVLFDADKLDAIGAIGVARAFAVAGAQRQHLWAEVAEDVAARPPEEGRNDLTSGEHTPVHEFRFKLARLRDRMLTPAGRRLAEERHRTMVAFFDRLEREVAGEA
jgi:uncharacterized protein